MELEEFVGDRVAMGGGYRFDYRDRLVLTSVVVVFVDVLVVIVV